MKLNKDQAEEITSNKQIDYYRDPRDGTENMPPETLITCRHFLEAVEKELYGWRWECPAGGNKCSYMHRVPPGYKILSKGEREQAKKDMLDRKNDDRTLEEIIEEERAALPNEGLTPVTKESFFAWKDKRKK